MARVTHVKKAMKDQGTCGACGEPIVASQAYKWAKPGFRGRKISRHEECRSFRPSELAGSPYISQLYAAQESIEDALAEWEPTAEGEVDDLTAALEEAAGEAREVAEAYEAAAEAMGDAGESMRDEYAAPAEEWADALEGVDLPSLDEPEEGETEEEAQDRIDAWADEVRDAIETAAGELAL